MSDLQLGFDWTVPGAQAPDPCGSRHDLARMTFPDHLRGAPGSTLITLVCRTCGRNYTRTKRQLRTTSGRYCSLSCSSRNPNRVRPKVKMPRKFGAENPNWKGGVAKDHMRYKRRFEAKSPEKVQAHQVVKRAVKAGRLIPKDSCEHCGAIGRPHAHHDDYSKPLEVIWLCQPCHNRHHAKLRMRGKNP